MFSDSMIIFILIKHVGKIDSKHIYSMCILDSTLCLKAKKTHNACSLVKFCFESILEKGNRGL